MSNNTETLGQFLARTPPFNAVSGAAREAVWQSGTVITLERDAIGYSAGTALPGFLLVLDGALDRCIVTGDVTGDVVMRYGPGDAVESQAFLRRVPPVHTGVAATACRLVCLPRAVFDRLAEEEPGFLAFFDPPLHGASTGQPVVDPNESLAGMLLSDVMTPKPVTLPPSASARAAAEIMAERRISCVLVVDDGRLVGLLTTGDMTARVVAKGRDADTPIGEIMTSEPLTLASDALVFDAMLTMSTRSIGHLPITRDQVPVGILTRSNLVLRRSVSAISMIARIGEMDDRQAMGEVVREIPRLLAAMVGAGVPPHRIGHIVTSIADAVTHRLVAMAERELGPAPVPYLWLACGSQGRREQTGVSDQDNCLILDDAYDPEQHGAYFERFAHYVCDGLDAAGYVHCPGDMMASNPQWRQAAAVWRGYFKRWIAKPDPMAQMLASVMFDLRPIVGDTSLYGDLQRKTLKAASTNSIFLAHMIHHALTLTPPLGLFWDFAVIRGGEHKKSIDLKHNGVAPIVDLARIYAMQGRLQVVGTRDRLAAARDAGVLSPSGADDLSHAFDLISRMRLEHQAAQIRIGHKPDSFVMPYALSALEQNQLKDAFGVVKTMQSALAYGRSVS